MTSSSCSTVKFLYSYGGKILPRRPDGQLRYVGGHTRVLSVHESITFAELMVKFGELCGESMTLKCKLPSEDLDVLVSVKSDEDLRHVMEEYEHFSPSTNRDTKIRAVLSPVNLPKKATQPSSPISCLDFPTLPPSKSKPSSPQTPLTWRLSPLSFVRSDAPLTNGVRHSLYLKNSQGYYCQRHLRS